MQLGLLPGFDVPALASSVMTELIEDKPKARAVSAERELLAAQVSMDGLAVDPPELEGWREELGRPRPRIVAGVCSERAARLDAEGNLAPCGWVACPRHLLLDYGTPITIGKRRHVEVMVNRAGDHTVMGRRPSLSAVPTDGEVEAFEADVLDRLESLPDTCALDVQARHGGAVPVDALARALGISEEQVRLDGHAAAGKIGIALVEEQPVPVAPAKADELLRQLSPVKPKIRRTGRGRIAKSLPVPASIVRRERDAPPVVMKLADAIFTF